MYRLCLTSMYYLCIRSSSIFSFVETICLGCTFVTFCFFICSRALFSHCVKSLYTGSVSDFTLRKKDLSFRFSGAAFVSYMFFKVSSSIFNCSVCWISPLILDPTFNQNDAYCKLYHGYLKNGTRVGLIVRVSVFFFLFQYK